MFRRRSRTAPRRSAGWRRAISLAMSSRLRSYSSATAVAASTFIRLPRPRSAVSMVRSPAGVSMSALMPRMPRSRTSRARTVAPPASPKVSTLPGNPAARDITRGSSALHTSTVLASARSRISPLASAMASADAKNPRCASPTLVHTRVSGAAISTSVLISPA
jgi:hypothetical protein